MRGKSSNGAIIFILLIIVVLGGLYAYKVSGGSILPTKENESVQEIVVNDINTDIENDVPNIVEGEQEEEEVQTVVIPTIESNNSAQSTEKISTYQYNNKYYYSQLDNYSKMIYDAIVNNLGNLKYGSYVININGDFSELLDQSNGQSKLKNYYDDAVNAINLDVPNLFYIDFSKMYLNIETTTTLFGTTYNLYIDAGGNNAYFSSGFTSQSQVEKAINSIESAKNSVCRMANGDDYNKIRTTHDWLIENISYDDSSYNKGNVYGTFMEKKVVCEGYARAYKYMLDNLGVTNILVTGTATNSSNETEEHMWNYVKLNGQWYAVDPTWDDPIVYGGGTVSTGTKHKYFLIGSKELYKSHVESKTISSSGKTFILPTISEDNY